MTDPGARPHLVTIERATIEQDDYGGEVLTWGELVTAYARVSHGSGSERREAAQEAAVQAATFEFDWNPILEGVRAKDRLQAFGSAWDIVSVAVIGANRDVHITATVELESAEP